MAFFKIFKIGAKHRLRAWKWLRRRILWLILRSLQITLVLILLVVMGVAMGRWAVPPTTYLMRTEAARLNTGIRQSWTALEDFTPDLPRSVVAAEDASFCDHGGFDWDAIRSAWDGGAARGGSTISQQVAKNAYLWSERTWTRKGAEALVTLLIEATWPKDRILEVYLNLAETGEGRFGMAQAASEVFNAAPGDLSLKQAASLAMILPNPKGRDATRPSQNQQRRIAAIMDGARTLARTGRDQCFVVADPPRKG